jgi:hypothetical protein
MENQVDRRVGRPRKHASAHARNVAWRAKHGLRKVSVEVPESAAAEIRALAQYYRNPRFGSNLEYVWQLYRHFLTDDDRLRFITGIIQYDELYHQAHTDAIKDSGALNQAFTALVDELRGVRCLPPGRPSALAALGVTWRFLIQFEPVLTEGLHVPLMSLHSALLALDQNNVEPILKPTKRMGHPASSPRRNALIGIAVGAARRLEWTGLSPMDANKAVATKLNALGVKPTRGKGDIDITADTLRRWREKISATEPLLRSLPQILQSEPSAREGGWINAAHNANIMMTEESRAQIAALVPAHARRSVLLLLEKSISEMTLADPAKPPT